LAAAAPVLGFSQADLLQRKNALESVATSSAASRYMKEPCPKASTGALVDHPMLLERLKQMRGSMRPEEEDDSVSWRA
jgi:hypothetical protein